MTSKTFIKEVADKTSLSQKYVKEILYDIEEVLKEVISRGETVKVMDINYSVKDVDARIARNPSTGETFEVPATKKVVVKPSSSMKKVVKE